MKRPIGHAVATKGLTHHGCDGGFVGLLSLLLSIGIIAIVAVFAMRATIPQFVPSASPDDDVSGARAQAYDISRQADLREIQTMLEVYISQVGQYPSSLQELVTYGLAPESTFPKDPVTGGSYAYVSGGDRIQYQLCATLSAGQQYCLESSSAFSPSINE